MENAKKILIYVGRMPQNEDVIADEKIRKMHWNDPKNLLKLTPEVVRTDVYNVNPKEITKGINDVINSKKNKDIDFKFVVVAENRDSVSFYADKEVDTLNLGETDFKEEKTMSLEVEKKLLSDLFKISEHGLKNKKNITYTSLDKVKQIILYDDQERVPEKLINLIRANDNHNSGFINVDANYNDKTITVKMSNRHGQRPSYMVFKKENNAVILFKSMNAEEHASDALIKYGKLLNMLFDQYFKDKNSSSNEIRLADTDLVLKISQNEYAITNNKEEKAEDFFRIGEKAIIGSGYCANQNTINFKNTDYCKSYQLSNIVGENKDSLIKNIRIETALLPKWIQEQLIKGNHAVSNSFIENFKFAIYMGKRAYQEGKLLDTLEEKVKTR